MTGSRRHDPCKKRSTFSVRKRVKVAKKSTVEDEICAVADGATLLGSPDCGRLAIKKKLQEIAPLLWSSSYREHLDTEARELAAMGVFGGAAFVKALAPSSTYAKRGLQRASTAERRNHVAINQMRNVAAAAIRQANQQSYPFSVCARSVAMLMRRSTTFDWSDKMLNRSILSKPTAVKLVKYMMEVKPKPNFKTMNSFAFHIFDQCYKKKGKTRKEHRAAERVDAAGDLVDLISMVIVNSVSVHVPATLGGGMSPRLEKLMKEKGPYTEPFESVLPHLEPDRVRASKYAFMSETSQWITRTAARFKFGDEEEHTIASMARALVGRPAIRIMKTPMDFNKPILNCDTNKHTDGLQICRFLTDKSPDPVVCVATQSDGQSMVTQARVKKHWPAAHKHILICCGPFHAFGHFMFGGHEGFYCCFTGFFARVLHRDKVPEVIPDFTNDAYKHVLAHHLELTIGTYTYFTSDVQNPPSHLFLSDPLLYHMAIEHAGGKVAFSYLRDVGNPTLHWLLAGREGSGDRLEKLYPMSFHMFRSLTHKKNCVFITLLALFSTTAVDPELAGIVKQLASSSLSGESLMFGDRLLEYLNLMQDQRDGKFAAFDRSMHYTDELMALLHVAQVWDASERGGESPLNDPVTQAMLNGAAVVRNNLRAKLGTDLTIYSNTNPFWHTGNPVQVDPTHLRTHDPAQFIDRVAIGAVAGKYRKRKEDWNSYTKRVIREQMFKY